MFWALQGRTNRRFFAIIGPKMAGVTGLEPAASGVTGQRSNQLSYTPGKGLDHLALCRWDVG